MQFVFIIILHFLKVFLNLISTMINYSFLLLKSEISYNLKYKNIIFLKIVYLILLYLIIMHCPMVVLIFLKFYKYDLMHP